MKLYAASELAHIPWPQTPDGAYAQSLLGHFLQQGTNHYIANVHVELYVLIDDDLVLPVAIPKEKAGNCYVCSPYEHYVTYTLYELSVLGFKPLEWLLGLLIKVLALILRWGRLSRVVYLNNWFLSTNLYPAISAEQLARISAWLQTQFPDRAIVLRSLNRYTNQNLLDALHSLGYDSVLSRQLYISDPHRGDYKKKRDFKADARLLRESDYEVVDASGIAVEDYERIVELYNALYVEKYTDLNPLFTRELIALAIKDDVLTIKGLRKDGRIDAVLGYFCRNGVMTTPLFGYDIKMDPKIGLYRMLSNLLVQESERQQCILNQSSGASKFKMTRGCHPHLEYAAVYAQHTSWRQRFVWKSLGFILRRIAEPLMSKYQL